MYKITVPMVIRNIERAGGKQKILEQLKRLDAERVILALGAMSVNTDEKEHEITCTMPMENQRKMWYY